jgi:hypothetical protein
MPRVLSWPPVEERISVSFREIVEQYLGVKMKAAEEKQRAKVIQLRRLANKYNRAGTIKIKFR